MNRSDRKSHPDARLDRILAQLGDAQPAAGLNDRLLRRLEDHATVPNTPAYAPRRQAGLRKAWWGFLAASPALAAALAFLFLPAHHAVTPAPVMKRHHVFVPPIAPSGVGSSFRERSALQPPALRSRSLTSSPQPAPRPDLEKQPAALNAEEARALDDLHALSQPAPPMPLTAGERLLTRMSRRPGSIELAELAKFAQFAPDWLEATQNGEQAAFKSFFDPPPPPKPEDPPPTTPPASTPPSSTAQPQGKVQ